MRPFVWFTGRWCLHQIHSLKKIARGSPTCVNGDVAHRDGSRFSVEGDVEQGGGVGSESSDVGAITQVPELHKGWGLCDTHLARGDIVHPGSNGGHIAAAMLDLVAPHVVRLQSTEQEVDVTDTDGEHRAGSRRHRYGWRAQSRK
jgi:hypothetical protein